jgi:hypothetical protein
MRSLQKLDDEQISWKRLDLLIILDDPDLYQTEEYQDQIRKELELVNDEMMRRGDAPRWEL